MQVLDGEQMRIEVLAGKLRMLLPFDHNATPHGGGRQVPNFGV